MAFPDIRAFPESDPGPYERQMGEIIAKLLRLFEGHAPDAESHARVSELAASPGRWSAGHAVFRAVRRRLNTAGAAGDVASECQHSFEESCCQAMYNATEPPDPFDQCSAFFVAGQALALAVEVGLPVEAVVSVLTA